MCFLVRKKAALEVKWCQVEEKLGHLLQTEEEPEELVTEEALDI